METDTAHEEQQNGYTLADLERLERLFKAGHFKPKGPVVSPESKEDASRDRSSKKKKGRSQPKFFVPLRDVDKLKLVRERRERLMASRIDNGENLVVRLVSTGSPLPRIRVAEIKGISYWYRRGQEDYVQNWFLKYTPMRRYYEEVSLDSVDPMFEKLGDRSIELDIWTRPGKQPQQINKSR
jgi:hypothetical protein